MKQVFLSKGSVTTRDVVPPTCKNNCLLIRTVSSCISAGTEMTGVVNGKKKLIKIAMEKPKIAVKFCRLVVTHGPKFVVNTIKNILGTDFGKTMGYSAAGIVVDLGLGVEKFKIGQRVAAVGTNVANHAGYNCVPVNLAIPIPDEISNEDAATAALGGIAFQGVRRLGSLPGDSVVVMGLGFIGQLTAQILVASGCKVTGIDINNTRIAEAKATMDINVLNGNDPILVEKAVMLNNGYEYDGVIFTAATHSSGPMSSCFKMLRRKGTFVLVGVSGMSMDRNEIYAKELDFRMATSYGFGRYDDEYEIKGNDYPVEFVRFTIKRNIEAYFDLLAKGKISLDKLKKSIEPVEKANEAFRRLSKPNPPMISIITYSESENRLKKIVLSEDFKVDKNRICYAIIGTGGYASNMHLPNLSQLLDKYQLKAVMNRSPGSAAALAVQYHAAYYTIDAQDIFDDPDIQMVMICTQHNSHANYVCRALRAGKDVFVEKPAALNQKELDEIKVALEETGHNLMVGFNRRFSKFVEEIKRRVSIREGPIVIDYSMCAGFVPYDSWVHGPDGGGRIVGEGCHIVDICKYLIGSKIKEITTSPLRFSSKYFRSVDNTTVTLEYVDGSIATIRYLSCSSDAVPKERMRMFFDGKEILLDNYTSLKGNGLHVKGIRSFEPDKGQKDILIKWHKALTNKEPLIPFEDIYETTMATFKIRNDILNFNNSN